MKKFSFLKNARMICFCTMLLLSASSAFAMWYVDGSGNVTCGPDPEYFESQEDWENWYKSVGLKPYFMTRD